MKYSFLAMKAKLFVLGLLCALAAQSAAGAEQFQAGAATSNITPDIGSEVIGGFVPFPSRHVHDELHARCLVLDDGKTRLALVVCDLLGIDRVVSEEARKLIAERHGIPRERVLISATHTHSAATALGKDARKLGQTADDYQRFVARRIADGVTRAINNLRPARIAFGTAEAPEHVFNRRWHMRAGTVPVNPFGGSDMVKMNPPGGSDNLVEPAGPTDPTVSFIAVRDPEDRPIAVFAAYSLHYVGGVGRGHVSADYFAVFSEHLKHLLTADGKHDDAPPFVAMMANGTSGDINNINFRKPRGRKKPYEQIRVVGEDVAETVHAAMASLTYRDHVTLAAAYREPVIAWRRPLPEQHKWAEDTIAAGKRRDRDLSFIYAERTMRLAEYPDTTTVPLQVLRIGDVCLGTLPFEVFCEIGLDFKSRSPLQPAFMVELAHGYFGYLPTPRQHRLGGYETWLGTNRVEPEASDKLLGTLLEMAGELQTELRKETAAATSDSNTTSLFNGKDLTGWHVDVPQLDKTPDAKATFVVRDGKLVSLGRPNGHLITDAKHGNYRLEVEYRFAAKPGNCGVLVHASTPRALYKMFPKSLEVQMNHRHAGDFWCIVEDITVPDMVKRRGPKETWGITEGKARRILNLTDDSEKPVGQWNTMVIECVQDAVKVWVNGDLVNHGTKCTATKGQIALQAEGSEVEFRQLSLTPIAKLTD